MVTDCTCIGINALKDLTDLYIENATTYIEGKSKSKIYGKKVKNIADRIYNQLTADELTEKYNVTDLVKKNYRINEHRRSCEEGNISDCTFELDALVAFLHHSLPAQSKLICADRTKYRNRKVSEKELIEFRNLASLENSVDAILTDLLRSTFINSKEGKLLYNPFEEYVSEDVKEDCKSVR